MRVERAELVGPRRLLRVQEPWWRGESQRRDLLAAWVDLEHGSGHAWVELQGEDASLCGWID
jgi:hypothetical protein